MSFLIGNDIDLKGKEFWRGTLVNVTSDPDHVLILADPQNKASQG